MNRGARRGVPSAAPRGTCGVCATKQRLSIATGKVVIHGRTRETPNCEGSGEPPLRLGRDGQPKTGGTVVGWRDGEEGPTARDSASAGPGGAS